MNDGDVAVLHCQVERSLLVLRAKIFFSLIFITIKTFQKGCNTLTKLVFSYLIPEVWISFVL